MDLKSGKTRLVSIMLLSVLALAGYTSDCITAFNISDPINDVSDIYESTVWVHNTVANDTYAGTGWVVKVDKDHSYIMTAAHVINEPGNVVIWYWPKKGGWQSAAGAVIHSSGRIDDVAIIMTIAKLKPLPIATHEVYRANDEILVAGVQGQAPPALVAIGYITKVNRIIDKIEINGWSWRGHSGGPVIHRKSGKVIGFVTKFASNDVKHASNTECSTFRTIMEALASAGL